jgi:hypothetical protein
MTLVLSGIAVIRAGPLVDALRDRSIEPRFQAASAELGTDVNFGGRRSRS